MTIAQLSKPLTCLIARLLQPPFRSVNARRIYGASAASTPESSTKPHLLSSILLAALAAACGGDDGGIQNPGPVESVTITAPTTEIRVGQTVQLTATARDANGTVLERGFEWISGIGTVASVSQTGLVTGHVKGQSEIRAITDDVTGRLVITVEVAPPPQ